MQTRTPTETPIDVQGRQWRLGPVPRWTLILAWLAGVGGCPIAMWLTPDEPLGYALFAHAYLVAFTFYFSIALGALFFVMLHHITRAGWSVTLRRLAEALSANLFLLAPLGLLLLPAMPGLYEWACPWAALRQRLRGLLAPGYYRNTRPATSRPPGL